MRIATVTSLPCPSPLLLLLAQLLLRLLPPGPALAGAAAASSCPSHCTCSNQASRVICTRQSLDEVPESISVNTRYLNLQENTIQVTPPPRRVCVCLRVCVCVRAGGAPMCAGVYIPVVLPDM